jgi:site-specific DNA-methyltransferase (adenine-specific)
LPRQTALKLDAQAFDVTAYLKQGSRIEPAYVSALGALFATDCMTVLPDLRESVIDTVFADPPFNLGKEYGESFTDLRPDRDYVVWCKE